MKSTKFLLAPLTLTSLCLIMSACGGSSSDSDTTDSTGSTADSDQVGIDITQFVSGALASDITTETCTLSGGTQTSCYRIEIAGEPADAEIGPFCPETIDDTADDAGIWIENGETYDVDGDFIIGLASFYADTEWMLYDNDTREVFVTDTLEACEAAAVPNVAEEYQNYCVECDIEEIGAATQTFLIPVTPVALSSAASVGNDDIGFTLNGVVLAPPAPTDAILSNYTIAAFDDCGGHVNPNAGYHYHASTGCTETVTQTDGHSALLGYALDGYGIYAMLDADGNESTDLDDCRGHSDETRTYHYHSASAGENMFIGCFSGEQGSVE
jgi:hypothetical protein